MKKGKWAIFAVLVMFLGGCSDPYGACEKAAADIGSGIGAGMKTVDGLRVQGLISVQEETNVLGYLKFANDANGTFASCAQTAHTSGSKAGAFTSCAAAFSGTLNNPSELALLHVGNSQASQDIQTIVNGMVTGITAVTTALGGK
jgi:hypothetical protein